MTPPTVFISYQGKERNHPIVARFVHDLQTRAYVNTWVDSHRIIHSDINRSKERHSREGGNPERHWIPGQPPIKLYNTYDVKYKPGESISSAIELGILGADYFIYIVTANTAKSKWANSEFNYAYAMQFKEQNLKIIPVLADNITPPVALSSLQFIDLTKDYEQGFKYITDVILIPQEDKIVDFSIGKNIDGTTIIDVSSAITEKLIKYFAENPHKLKTFDRRKFEELIAELFNGFGYEVELTQPTRDGGRDVIAIRHGEVQVKYLIECKRPDPGKKIGVRPVRELLGTKTDEKASKAILATTAFFTRDALLFFERNKWDLEPKDFHGLQSWIDTYLKARNIGKGSV